MWTAIFTILALLNLALLIWGLRLYRQVPTGALTVLLLPILFLPYDNAIIAAGRFIGEGDLLRNLNWPRFAAHGLLTPLWIIAAGSLARMAGLGWAKNKWVMSAFCILATGLIVLLDVPKLLGLQLHPACFADTLRYAESVSAGQLCSPTQAVVPSSGPPIAAIAAILALLGVSVPIWRRTKWPWLFVGSVVMFLAAAAPASVVGPGVSSIGEVVLGAALLATAQRLGKAAAVETAPKPTLTPQGTA
ncbi:MAG: hypothetical protein RMK99_01810 [Anaerolineales bacterium]|nr:hypothetical protein [Anaerolineales bacterium]